MKKTFTLFLIFALALTVSLPALALEQSECFYVTDETGLLSQDTVDHVLELNYTLEERCGGAQIVVVFIDYFGDAYADEYAVSLFNSWSLSSRAMLLVVSPNEGRGGMTVGDGLKTAFSEDDINEYLDDYFWDDFDDGDYDEAVTKLSDELYDWFMDRYDTGSGTAYPATGDGGAPAQPKSGGSAFLAGLGVIGVILGFLLRNIVVILIFVLIIVLIIWSDRRRYRGYYRSIGQPIPRYYPWYMFSTRPYRSYRAPRPPRRPPPPPPPSGGGGGHRSPPPRSGPTPPRSRSPRPSSPRPSGPRPGGGGGFRPSGGGRSGGSFGGRR